MTQQDFTLDLAAASLRRPSIRFLTRRSSMPFKFLASLATLVVILQAQSDATLVNGLVAYYDFNESSGASLPIVVGSGNNGVLNNMNDADWVAGQANYGNALDFDGANDFVHIADGYTDTVSGDNTHTVSMWYYPRSYAGDP